MYIRSIFMRKLCIFHFRKDFVVKYEQKDKGKDLGKILRWKCVGRNRVYDIYWNAKPTNFIGVRIVAIHWEHTGKLEDKCA